jgi:TPP-dependent 2-oxoacid decarboxylase
VDQESKPSCEVYNKTSTLAQFLLDELKSRGLNKIFGIPGDFTLKFNQIIEGHSIDFINGVSENTVGIAADSYARLQGLGAVSITYGVGIGIINAIAQAYVEYSPLIVIAGAPGAKETEYSTKIHHMIGDSTDTLMTLFEPVTVARTALTDPETAVSEIRRVIDACLESRQPVYIELPRDLLDAEVHIPEKKENVPKKVHPELLDEALSTFESYLSQAKRPLIWAGTLIRSFGLDKDLLSFARTYNIPIVTTLLGKGTINEYDPLSSGVYIGDLSNDVVKKIYEESDCILLLGMIPSDVNLGLFSAKIDQKKCLIAERHHLCTENKKHPIHLRHLIRALANDFRLSQRFQDRVRPSFEIREDLEEGPITIKQVLTILQKHLKEEDLLIPDIGDALFSSIDIKVGRGGYLSSAYYCSLGFAIPAAIGAKLANPERTVIALEGDGGFQMTSLELSTALRYGLNPIIIVLNNQGYGTERPIIDGPFNDIVNWNYHKIPELFGGGKGVYVETAEAFSRALEDALENEDSYTLIEVKLDKMDFSPVLKKIGRKVNKGV